MIFRAIGLWQYWKPLSKYFQPTANIFQKLIFSCSGSIKFAQLTRNSWKKLRVHNSQASSLIWLKIKNIRVQSWWKNKKIHHMIASSSGFTGWWSQPITTIMISLTSKEISSMKNYSNKYTNRPSQKNKSNPHCIQSMVNLEQASKSYSNCFVI